MKQTTHSRHLLSLAVAALAAGPAQAVKFELDNGVSGSFDTTLSFGFQRRMSGQDKSIIGNDSGGNVPTSGTLGTRVNGPGNGATANPDFNYTNVDDGDLNYNKGDIVSAVVKGTHELFLKNSTGWAASPGPATSRPPTPDARRSTRRRGTPCVRTSRCSTCGSPRRSSSATTPPSSSSATR